MKGLCNVLEGLKPVMLMVFVQSANATVTLLFKLAINDGMSMRVASAYRLIFASAFTIPLALFLDRKKRPNITLRVLFMEFLCGLFGGSLFINLFFEGLALVSATFVSAIFNLAPAITFIMALTCGLEKSNWGAAAGKAKVIGTLTGISGAMVLTFFKGAELDIWSSHINLLHSHHHNPNGHIVAPLHPHSAGSKLLGVLCATGCCCSYSLWVIIQAKTNEEFPSRHTGTALMCTMGAMQSTVFALCVDRDWSQWKLGWNIRFISVAFAGIVASGLTVNAVAWCIHMRGPLFASVFNPLQLVAVAIAASLLLNEKLYLGSVIGGVMIVCGLYTVLWGKSKEMKKEMSTKESSEAVHVVVMSTQIDHDKGEHHDQGQTTATKNVSKENAHASHDHIPNKKKGELPT